MSQGISETAISLISSPVKKLLSFPVRATTLEGMILFVMDEYLLQFPQDLHIDCIDLLGPIELDLAYPLSF
jgi:hypothetical protein